MLKLSLLKRRVLTILLSVVLMLTMVPVQAFKAKAAEPPVQLYYANYRYDHYDPTTYKGYFNFTGYIAIADIAYHKSVTVEYKKNEYAKWSADKSVNAYYVKDDLLTGQDIFTFQTPLEYLELNRFGNTHIWIRIKYRVNGKTYYDDNGGKGYHIIGPYYNHTVFQPMVISKLILKVSHESTSVLLQDLGSNKKVVMRYTDNNWASYKEAEYRYCRTYLNGQELWTLDQSAETVMPDQYEFAVYYQVNGQTYWDNNFGENYQQ